MKGFCAWGIRNTSTRFVAETAHYRVSFGLLGQVAEATISLTPSTNTRFASANQSPSVIHATGKGQGAILGFAKSEKHIESDFNSQTLLSTRWTSTWSSGSQTVVDIIEQQKPGAVSILRKSSGKPDRTEALHRASSVFDPLGLLLYIRFHPPSAPTSLEILDGRALWIMKLSAVQPTSETAHKLRLDGYIAPVRWDGTPDEARTARSFTLYLSDDAYHTPLALVVPFGFGEARADLIKVTRPRHMPRHRFMRQLLAAMPHCLYLRP